MNRFILIVTMISLISCTTVQTAQKNSWNDFNFSGLILDLRDQDRVNWYLFHPDGYVSATIGKRNRYLTGPLYYWKLQKDNLEIFSTPDGSKIVDRLRFINANSDNVTVRDINGIVKTFKISYDK